MDNFNYQAYLKSGKIHGEQAMLTESEQVSEKNTSKDTMTEKTNL